MRRKKEARRQVIKRGKGHENTKRVGHENKAKAGGTTKKKARGVATCQNTCLHNGFQTHTV